MGAIMGIYFTDEVQIAYEKVFYSWDPLIIQEGQSKLQIYADQGNGDAAALLSRTYAGSEFFWPGASIKENDALTAHYLQQSIKQSSAIGLLQGLRTAGAILPSLNRQLPITKEEAFNRVLSAAIQGDAYCQYVIGNVYYWGDYTTIGPSAINRLHAHANWMSKLKKLFISTRTYYQKLATIEAAYWLDLSLTNGFSMFPDNLRNLYLRQKKYDLARSVMTRAASCGNPNAMYWCGIYAEKDDNDIEKALYWYEQAAQYHDIDGLEEAGDMYFKNKGIPLNGPKAVTYYEEAASLGNPYCMIQCVYAYFFGLHGITADYGRSAYWALRALGSSHESYLYPFLSYMYLHGLGVTQDRAAALYYLQKGLQEFKRRAKENNFQYVPLMQEILFCALGYAHEQGYFTKTPDFEKAVLAYQQANCREGEERLKSFSYANGIWTRHDESSRTTCYQFDNIYPRQHYTLYISKHASTPAHRTSLHSWDMLVQELSTHHELHLTYNTVKSVPHMFVAIASVSAKEIDAQHIEITFYGSQEISREDGLLLQKEPSKKENTYIPMVPINDGQQFLVDQNVSTVVPRSEAMSIISNLYSTGALPSMHDWHTQYRTLPIPVDSIILEVDQQTFILTDLPNDQEEITAALLTLQDGGCSKVALHLESFKTGAFCMYRSKHHATSYRVQLFMPNQGSPIVCETEIHNIISLNYWLSAFLLNGAYPDTSSWRKKRLKLKKS